MYFFLFIFVCFLLFTCLLPASGWLKDEDHELIRRVSLRIEDVTGLTMDTAEELQVCTLQGGVGKNTHGQPCIITGKLRSPKSLKIVRRDLLADSGSISSLQCSSCRERQIHQTVQQCSNVGTSSNGLYRALNNWVQLFIGLRTSFIVYVLFCLADCELWDCWPL